MTPSRFILRASLAVVFALSIFVVIAALISGTRGDLQTWAAVAAALAVLSSVLSAWSAQRVLELQEDQSRPYPYPFVDSSSRYGLLLLRVRNFGGTAAHNIRIDWDKPLTNSKGERISFKAGIDGAEIAVLLPHESIATLIDGSLQFFQTIQPPEADYTGLISFTDPSGTTFQHRFRVNAGQYLGTLVHADESIKTHRELQSLPGKIDDLARELRYLRDIASEAVRSDDPDDGENDGTV